MNAHGFRTAAAGSARELIRDEENHVARSNQVGLTRRDSILAVELHLPRSGDGRHRLNSANGHFLDEQQAGLWLGNPFARQQPDIVGTQKIHGLACRSRKNPSHIDGRVLSGMVRIEAAENRQAFSNDDRFKVSSSRNS
jgi:hypothetical protein